MRPRTIGESEKIREVTTLLKELRKSGTITVDEFDDIVDILYREPISKEE